MESAGVIRGYRVAVDQAALGRGLMAVVRVVTRPTPTDAPFEEFVLQEPRIVECYDVDGEDSFFLKVRCADPLDLQSLLVRIRALPAVQRTITNIVLKPMKETE